MYEQYHVFSVRGFSVNFLVFRMFRRLAEHVTRLNRGTSLFYAMSSSSGGEEDDKFYWDGRAKDSDAYLGEDVFKVEAIRRRRIREGETEYLIKWLGWES